VSSFNRENPSLNSVRFTNGGECGAVYIGKHLLMSRRNALPPFSGNNFSVLGKVVNFYENIWHAVSDGEVTAYWNCKQCKEP